MAGLLAFLARNISPYCEITLDPVVWHDKRCPVRHHVFDTYAISPGMTCGNSNISPHGYCVIKLGRKWNDFDQIAILQQFGEPFFVELEIFYFPHLSVHDALDRYLLARRGYIKATRQFNEIGQF